MNLILLDPAELNDAHVVRLADRRSRHLHDVLRVELGDRVRVGVIDGPSGEAEVIGIERDATVLRCTLDRPPVDLSDDTLLMAMPRPKVLLRCLEHAAALGFGKIIVFRSKRVVKSHFTSHALDPQQITSHLRAGLEQSRRTRMPSFRVFARFKPFVEDDLDALATQQNRILADADVATPLAEARLIAAPFTLALGPEGGLIPYEIDALRDRGFVTAHAGNHPLRVEAALNFVSGQLWLLRDLARKSTRSA
jgi:RsmE family RNA methyltransferase